MKRFHWMVVGCYLYQFGRAALGLSPTWNTFAGTVALMFLLDAVMNVAARRAA